MNFAAPGAAALIAIGGLILVQYILRLRRRERPIPSTFLWQRALLDSRANAPWQRLVPDALLLLQLLAVLALVLALMRPYVLHAGAPEANVVLVLDASLNSQFVEHGQSRFVAEFARAQSAIDDLPPGYAMSIVRLDGHPRVLAASIADQGALRSILDSQHPGYDQPDSRAALSLAASLIRQSNTRVLILHAANTAIPVLNTNAIVQDISFGSSSADNLGIAALSAVRAADGSVSALVRVANTGSSTRSTTVNVRTDGRLEDVRDLTVAAGSQTYLISTGLPAGTRVVEAQLSAADALAADNTAWAVLNQPATRHLLLVTRGNVFLQAALTGDPAYMASRIAPSAYNAAAAEQADAVILDGFLPAAGLPANALLINPPDGALSGAVGPPRPAGTPRVDDDPANLLQYMSVGNLHIASTHALTAPSWAHVALRDGAGPLLLEGEQPIGGGNTRRVAVLGFDLHQSDFPLSLDYPIFIANVLQWLAPPAHLMRVDYSPGDSVPLDLPADARNAEIVLPGGARLPLAGLRSGALFSQTNLPGVYTVDLQAGAARQTMSFTVNTGVPSHAAVAPPATVVRQPPTHAPPRGQVPFELTGGVIAIVLVVLGSEWYVAMRRR